MATMPTVTPGAGVVAELSARELVDIERDDRIRCAGAERS